MCDGYSVRYNSPRDGPDPPGWVGLDGWSKYIRRNPLALAWRSAVSGPVKYGFVSAGGGERFRDAMARLQPNGRVWVNLPGSGYVGVGVVEDPAVRVTDFVVVGDGGTRVPILQAPLKATQMGARASDPEMAEYLVRVKWIQVVPLSRAVRERGFFGNQNCVVQPKDAKWPYTIERLKQLFGISV